MLRRFRAGEWIALGGLVGLLVTLFLEWFTASVDLLCEPATTTGGDPAAAGCPPAGALVSGLIDTGWGALGRPWADFLVVVVVVVVVMLAMTLRAGPGRPTYGAVVSLVVAGFVTFLVMLLTAIRVLLARPGIELPGAAEHLGLDEAVRIGIGPGGWIGLASLLVILIGLWVAIADDRTDAPDSAFDPPAPRPVPEPAARPTGDAPASSREA